MRNLEIEKSKEFEFNPKSIAIVATTFSPDWYLGDINSIADTGKIRGDLAPQSRRMVKRTSFSGCESFTGRLEGN